MTGKKLLEALEQEKAQASWEEQKVLENADARVMIKALYDRGVPYSTIFGTYYELEEAGNGRMITVEDARLAGHPPVEMDCV